MSVRLSGFYLGEEDPKNRVSLLEGITLAVLGLATNYRVGAVEAVSLLQLIGSDEQVAICRALIDADEIDKRVAEIMDDRRTGTTDAGTPAAVAAPAVPPSPGERRKSRR
jgi:hypothetical protein